MVINTNYTLFMVRNPQQLITEISLQIAETRLLISISNYWNIHNLWKRIRIIIRPSSGEMPSKHSLPIIVILIRNCSQNKLLELCI